MRVVNMRLPDQIVEFLDHETARTGAKISEQVRSYIRNSPEFKKFAEKDVSATIVNAHAPRKLYELRQLPPSEWTSEERARFPKQYDERVEEIANKAAFEATAPKKPYERWTQDEIEAYPTVYRAAMVEGLHKTIKACEGQVAYRRSINDPIGLAEREAALAEARRQLAGLDDPQSEL